MFIMCSGEENYPDQARRTAFYFAQLDLEDRMTQDGVWTLTKTGKDELATYCRRSMVSQGFDSLLTAVWIEDEGAIAQIEVAFYRKSGLRPRVNRYGGTLSWLNER